MSQPWQQKWTDKSWEAMAQENPLGAIMTTEAFAEAGAEGFTPEQLEAFFAKGQALFERWVRPMLSEGLVVDYGCGAGRVMKWVIEAGFPCAGVDISPTMARHGRELVPRGDFRVLDADGRCDLPDGCAQAVYSYAVVQHISKLSRYVTAFDEMCRMLRPGGRLAVQVATEDFRSGDLARPARTVNQEDWSEHVPLEGKPWRHEQTNWDGVYIGHDRLIEILAERGVMFDEWRFHKAKPSRANVVWALAHKPA